MTKGEQITRMIHEFVKPSSDIDFAGFDELQTRVVIVIATFAVHIERGTLRWDDEKKVCIRTDKDQRVVLHSCRSDA